MTIDAILYILNVPHSFIYQITLDYSLKYNDLAGATINSATNKTGAVILHSIYLLSLRSSRVGNHQTMICKICLYIPSTVCHAYHPLRKLPDRLQIHVIQFIL